MAADSDALIICDCNEGIGLVLRSLNKPLIMTVRATAVQTKQGSHFVLRTHQIVVVVDLAKPELSFVSQKKSEIGEDRQDA